MKRAYIAGCYRAEAEFQVHDNITKARVLAERLWRLGYAVFTPHMNSAHLGGIVPDEQIIQGCLAWVEVADVMVMLRGWENSEGAKREHQLAFERGIPIYHEDDVIPALPIASEPGPRAYEGLKLLNTIASLASFSRKWPRRLSLQLRLMEFVTDPVMLECEWRGMKHATVDVPADSSAVLSLIEFAIREMLRKLPGSRGGSSLMAEAFASEERTEREASRL